MGLLRTARSIAGASICVVAHALMVVGIACAGGLPESEPSELEDDEDDPRTPLARPFEHTSESRRMIAEGMPPRREFSVVSGGSLAGQPMRARR